MGGEWGRIMVNRDLAWIWYDAIELRDQGKNDSALLLLLCAVEALAGRRLERIRALSTRFEKYLSGELAKRVPLSDHLQHKGDDGRKTSLAASVYRFLRNPSVQEGAQAEAGPGVQIDWGDAVVVWDPTRSPIVIAGQWLYKQLEEIVGDEIWGTSRSQEARSQDRPEIPQGDPDSSIG